MTFVSSIESGPFTAAAGQTVFPFTLSLASATEIEVAVNGSIIAQTAYSVTFGNTSGSVTFSTPMVGGEVVVIRNKPDFTQATEFDAQGAYSLEAVNKNTRRSIIRDIYLRANPATTGPPGGSNNTYVNFADVAAKIVPIGTNQISVTGISAVGDSGAGMVLVYDAAVDAAYVAANPTTSVLDAAGRGFRIAAVSAYKPLRSVTSYPTLAGALTSLSSGVLRLEPKTYSAATITTRTNGLTGTGIGATVINPASATGIALTSTANGGGWDFAIVENLSVTGTGTRQGIGYQFGPTSYTTGAEYTGRTVFDRVGFNNLDKCINRPWGSIGLYTRNCQFGSANYHLFVSANVGSGGGGSGDVMHAGTAFLYGDNAQGAQIASNYLEGKSVIGTCQFIQRDRILEGNPGWCHYFRNCNSAGGFPGFLIDGEYIENNYTATSVTTADGVTRAPKYLRALNTTSIVISNSCPGPMVLDGSHVTTIACDLTNVVNCEIGSDATLSHYQARSFNSQVDGVTYSIGAVLNQTSLSAPCYAMPVPLGFGSSTGTVVYAENCQSVISITGSAATATSSASGSALPGMLKEQQLTIANGQTLFPTATFTIPASKYLVVQYLARLISGPAITVGFGPTGFGGTFTVANANYRLYTQILQNTGSAITGENFWHFHGGGTSVVGIGHLSVVSFDTQQEALAYANSRLVPQATRSAYTLSGSTPTRSLTAAAAGTASGTYTQSELQGALNRIAVLENVLSTVISDAQKGSLPA